MDDSAYALASHPGNRSRTALFPALLLSLTLHIAILAVLGMPSSKRAAPTDRSIQLRLPPLSQQSDEDSATIPSQSGEASPTVDHEPRPVDEALPEQHVEDSRPVAEPSRERLDIGSMLRRTLEAREDGEMDYRLPGQADTGDSAFDPQWGERIRAAETYRRSAKPKPEPFTSYQEHDGSEYVEVGDNCFRVAESLRAGESREWVGARCKTVERLELDPKPWLQNID